MRWSAPERLVVHVLRQQPGLRFCAALSRSRRSSALLHRQADVVEAVQQAVLAEADRCRTGSVPPSGPRDLLLLEVDRDDGVGAAARIVHQLVDVLLRQHDRQDAVLEAVVVEDVGEARRDDAADAEIEQRPGRVLAARAAAEVLAGDQDLRVAVGRLVRARNRGFSWPSGRRSASRRTGSCRGPVRLIVFRNCLGMIMSVSTLIIGSGAATPVRVVKVSMSAVLLRRQLADVGQVAGRRQRPRPWPGYSRCVRPPAPWRPSKLRFDGAMRSARPGSACRRSCPGTWSSRARAIRSRLP